ncbi:MAG: aspartate aminotransferase family protein [Bacteroidales bacterium]|nr:aspartate aminotransferase family protein [Bacteroidales bacterium]
MITNRELFLNYLGQTSDSPYLVEIERAVGIYLYGLDNKKYIDLISGVSVNSLGHNFKPIVEAVKNQLDKHMHLMVYGEFIQNPQVQLSVYLAEMLPKNLNSVYFVNSGSEAVEGAIKLAKRYTGRTKMIAYNNAYHGSSHGAISVCGNEDFKFAFRPLLPEVYFLELNNYAQLDEIDENTACVILETIQAEAGVQIPEKKYIKKLADKCKLNGALLILDEIQTGFGRTGKMFGFQNYDIVPDIVCFAKAMGGGMPIGAFVAPKNIMDSFKTNPTLGHITTFGGHPVSAAASLAAIKHINESGLVNKVVEKEQLFRKHLKHKLITEIRGNGLLLAVNIGSFDNVLKLVKNGIELGFITDWFIFYDTAFRIAPPLNISNDEIIEACELIIEALNQI